MITKDKVFIVSSNVDDSIRSSSIYTDVKIFKTFKEFEDYIDVTPIDASMIIVNSKDLSFTNNSMSRLISVVQSLFVTLEGFLYYMVDDEEVQHRVEEICKKNNLSKIKCLYSSTLYAHDVANVLTGESLSSKETVTEISTYRIRASEYIRTQKDKEDLDYDNIYVNDEDELSGIEDEPVPEDLRATDSRLAMKHIVCGNSIRERCAWVVLKAQYLSLNGKVLILERDTEYHTLLDMITKVDVDYEFYDVIDIFRDCYEIISRIKDSKSRLIVIGSKNRVQYNYDNMINILVHNLEEDIDHYIYETELSQIPYGATADIVMPTTVPEILRSVNAMSSISDFKDLQFVGLDITNLGYVSISNKEFRALLREIFQENKIRSFVVKIRGLLLRKEVGLGGIFMYNQHNH